MIVTIRISCDSARLKPTFTAKDLNTLAPPPPVADPLGSVDYNNLTLGLDGFDTGLKLNGFYGEGNPVPQTLMFSGATLNASSILAALQADGKLVGTIIDATPNDNPMRILPGYDTILEITGQDCVPAETPEPASVALLGAGLLPLARKLRRRKH